MSAPRWAVEGRGWPNAAASRFVEAARIKWHVQVAGEGAVVLLLHGTGAATHSWRGVLPLLARHCRVIAPDLPGHGFTGPPHDADYSLPNMSRLIADLLGALDERPSIIVGHSAGAAIAVRMALDGLAALDRIVSFNGALLPFPGLARAMFPAMAKLLFVNPFVPRLFAMQARLTGDVSSFMRRSTGSSIDADGLSSYARLLRSSGHVGGALGMMANWDLEPLAADLSSLATPLTLAYGEQDAAIPPSVAAKTARLVPDATLVAMPGLGHLAHEEAPDLAANIILGQDTTGEGRSR